ncbi:MAG: MC/SLC25 family protein [Chlamydiota bacterium]
MTATTIPKSSATHVSMWSWQNTKEKFTNASITAGFLHISDVLKSTQQKHPEQTIGRIIRTTLFTHHHSLLTGFQTNYIRRASKDIAKWTVIDALQRSIIHSHPDLFKKNSLSTNILTACIAACFDTAVLFPIDFLNANRIKHSTKKMSYSQFIQQSYRQYGIRGFYCGAGADLSRQILGWNSFLLVDRFIKKQFDLMFPENPSPLLRQFIAANGIAGAYISLAQPFDAAKFHKQINPELENQSTLKTLQEIFKSKGGRGLYGGAAFIYASIVGRSLVWGGYKDKVMSTEKETRKSI